jgi:hypothetical protein
MVVAARQVRNRGASTCRASSAHTSRSTGTGDGRDRSSRLPCSSFAREFSQCRRHGMPAAACWFGTNEAATRASCVPGTACAEPPPASARRRPAPSLGSDWAVRPPRPRSAGERIPGVPGFLRFRPLDQPRVPRSKRSTPVREANDPSCRDFVGEEIEGIITSRSYTYDLCPRYAIAPLRTKSL